MSIEKGLPNTTGVDRFQEWQQLCWTAINQAIGQYLYGCADLAMARTPLDALAALHDTQTVLLKHLADTVAEAIRLLRKQNA